MSFEEAELDITCNFLTFLSEIFNKKKQFSSSKVQPLRFL